MASTIGQLSKTPTGDVTAVTVAEHIAWAREGGRGEISLADQSERAVTSARVIELWSCYAQSLTVFNLQMWTDFEGTEDDSGRRTLEIWLQALDPSLAPVGTRRLLCRARSGPAPLESLINWPASRCQEGWN